MDQRENRFYREPQPSGQQAEPVAWVHEDDPTRVISAVQKAGALKDGGASASSVRPYSLAAVLAGVAPSGEPIYQLRKADGSWIEQTEASYRYNLSYGHAVRIVYAAPKPSAPVVAWVRFRSDGGIEGPILDSDPRMDDARRKSGAWTALGVIIPQPSAQHAEQPAEEARGVDIRAALEMARTAMVSNGLTQRELPRVFEIIDAALLAAPAAGTGQEQHNDSCDFVNGVGDAKCNCGYPAATGAQGLTRERALLREALLWIDGTPDPTAVSLCADIRAILAQAMPSALSAAARDVLAERQRQIEAEGWTPEHDDEHDDNQLAMAAAWYATPPFVRHALDEKGLGFWPWAQEWWKPADRRRNLEKAGALVIAEIERLDRAAMAKGARS
ncbi:hypothetical protein NDR89_20540 [Cupriavidus gilardii]|uniref:DUF551 domain-containing protein n=1 Tax=Cupriavidus gilardii TaxID=82541 RepID=A0ABY4VUL4_9BURK|nr:hypothetical protein [Cupriavidus gilardii]USE79028.1 hypothetical protein NDR89_20540 [Cupriavidus gilardii]